VRWMQGDLDAALQDVNRALELQPQDVLALWLRGGIRQAQGEEDLAAQDYDEAIRLDPNCGDALYSRAGLRSQQGDLAGARADLAGGEGPRARPARPGPGHPPGAGGRELLPREGLRPLQARRTGGGAGGPDDGGDPGARRGPAPVPARRRPAGTGRPGGGKGG